jgi:hypothetical protein
MSDSINIMGPPMLGQNCSRCGEPANLVEDKQISSTERKLVFYCDPCQYVMPSTLRTAPVEDNPADILFGGARERKLHRRTINLWVRHA